MASTLTQTQDVRVTNHQYDDEVLNLRAAKAAAKFIRRQADVCRPADKVELTQLVWDIYWKLDKAGLLEASKATRRILRNKYGIWTKVGVDRD